MQQECILASQSRGMKFPPIYCHHAGVPKTKKEKNLQLEQCQAKINHFFPV